MSILDQIYEKARNNPQKVAFPEAANEKMMQAAYETGRDGYIIPVLVGNAEELKRLAAERGYDPSVFSFVDIEDEAYRDELIERYVNVPGTLLKQKPLIRRMKDPLYFAMVMQRAGDADVTFAGIDNTTGDVLLAGQTIIGIRPGLSTVSTVKAPFWPSETARYAPIRIPNSLPVSRSPLATR